MACKIIHYYSHVFFFFFEVIVCSNSLVYYKIHKSYKRINVIFSVRSNSQGAGIGVSEGNVPILKLL
jgi:hypothetical protein